MAHNLIVLYNGEWKDVDGISSFVANSTEGVTVPQNTTYAELVDILYNALEIDKSRYDLLLHVKYTVPGGLQIPPTVIKRDRNVTFYLNETSSPHHRAPLCVSLVEKSTRAGCVVAVPETQNDICRMDIIENPLPADPTPEFMSLFTNSTVFPGIDDLVFESQAGEGEEVPCLSPNQRVSDYAAPREPIPSRQFGSFENVGIPDPIPIPMPSTCEVQLKVGALYDDKKALQLSLHKHAMVNHFEFKVHKSNKGLLVVKCLDDKCQWKLRATKDKLSDMFEIRKFVREHTCSVVTRQENVRPAPAWVIGECVKSKYADHHHDHMPKKIIEDMQAHYGMSMSYNKAWRSREKALMAVRGSVEDSYEKLPSYLYMLQKKNPGTITDIQTDELGQFMYMFLSIGLSIRGFISCCRPVLCVDASFLKHKIGGQLLVAIALDANEQLYPVAFGVVDSENNNSWLYFMRKLRDAIGLVPELVFVSDRHPSIANALSAVFPEAHHCACTYHIKMNIKAKFKTDSCHEAFELASRAFTVPMFNRHFDRIRVRYPDIAAYLEEIGLERWSRALFPGKRYNIMTSNYAESFNSQCRNARKYPISTLVEYLRYTIQTWFNERREKASDTERRLSPHSEAHLHDLVEKSRLYIVNPLNRYEFNVHDGHSYFQVNLRAMSCSCRVYDTLGLPCTHALYAARKRKMNAYDFCSRYYTSESWLNAYAETCYPVCDEDYGDIPDDIKHRSCIKPPIKVKKGRPATKRRPSQGEPRKVQRQCSSCSGKGHNRATCKAVMPAPCTASTLMHSSSRPSTSTFELHTN